MSFEKEDLGRFSSTKIRSRLERTLSENRIKSDFEAFRLSGLGGTPSETNSGLEHNIEEASMSPN